MYVDIQGFTVNWGSIPVYIVPTEERPDIVCIDDDSKSESILELSVPFETNLSKIENAVYKCGLVCFEVGSRGIISSNNKGQFKKIANTKQAKNLRIQSSKIVISCPYVIFYARFEKDWYDPSNTF